MAPKEPTEGSVREAVLYHGALRRASGETSSGVMRRMASYCRARGWRPIRGYRDDGKGGHRLGLREALRALLPGRVLVVPELRHLAGSVVALAAASDDIALLGAAWLSVREGVGTADPPGREVASFLSALAAATTASHSEKTRAGLHRARTRGVHCGARPLGWRFDSAVGRYVEVADEQETLTIAHGLRREGLSDYAVAQELTCLGRRTARGGTIWHPASVATVLGARQVDLCRSAAMPRTASV
jgi:DNA invertase Pin-like site-specific DNA recombinase